MHRLSPKIRNILNSPPFSFHFFAAFKSSRFLRFIYRHTFGSNWCTSYRVWPGQCGMEEPTTNNSFFLDWTAGIIAGGANTVVGYSFDTVKVRLQANVTQYRGGWHCFRSIVRHEGTAGLFRGMSSPLLGASLETGINYAVFQATHDHLKGLPEAVTVPVSAATAGFFLSFVISPAELVKCRMQLGAADKAHTYSGPIDCLRQLIRSEGYRGLTRGLGSTIAREIPGNVVFFSVYKSLREVLPGNDPASYSPTDSTWQHSLARQLSTITCGAAAGMALWAAVLPIDVAKTRIQTAWPGSERDVGLMVQLRQLYREGGRRSLYAGLTPTLIRAAPANAAQWLVFEWCVQTWQEWGKT